MFDRLAFGNMHWAIPEKKKNRGDQDMQFPRGLINSMWDSQELIKN